MITEPDTADIWPEPQAPKMHGPFTVTVPFGKPTIPNPPLPPEPVAVRVTPLIEIQALTPAAMQCAFTAEIMTFCGDAILPMIEILPPPAVAPVGAPLIATTPVPLGAV